MKKTIILLIALFMVTFVVPIYAQESILPSNANKKIIEDNLFIGLASVNTGLQRSCALLLGRIKSDRAVIPLLEALHNNPDESVRIAAAWALCVIGDSRGVYAVKKAVKYDECPKVQSTCAWYYENYVKQGTFTFSVPAPEVAAITNR
jgi:hypothetical protein